MKQNFIMQYSAHCRTFWSRALIFLMVGLLSGCGAARLGYANGETLSYWWLYRYVAFDGPQQSMVKQRLDNLFTWHRTTQLTSYVQVLTSMQKRLQQNVSAADVKADYDKIKTGMLVMVDRAAPELADLALVLQPQQIVQMQKKLASNSEGYRSDYLDGDTDERQRFRFNKILDQAQYWFGDFSADQSARIRAASDARPLNNELWFAERVRRQQELIGMLKKIQVEKPTRTAATAMLRTYLIAGIERPADHEKKAFFDTSAESMAQLTSIIINLTTPAQKEHAMKKTQQWIDDFKALAVKAV